MLAGLSFVALSAIAVVFLARGEPSNRVFLIGWDGADPRAMDELLAAGKMPNLARLIERGSYGEIATLKPTLSPAIWTTVVTGVHRDTHGVQHFWKGKKAEGNQELYTSRDREVAAVWGIATAADRRVDVLGWWATWPAESIRGTFVSDRFAFNRMGAVASSFGQNVDLTPTVDGLYSPPEAAPIVEPCRVAAKDAKAPVLDRLRELDPAIPGVSEFKESMESFLSQDETNHCLTLALLERDVPEVLLTYYEGTDIAGHIAWGARYPRLYKKVTGRSLEPERAALLAGMVEDSYMLQDQRLGEILQFADERTTIIVMSDHGMHVGDDPTRMWTGQHTRAPAGIFILAGAGVRPGSTLRDPTMYDVLPTMLTLAGLPVADDLEGRVLQEALLDTDKGGPRRLPHVATYRRGPRADLPASGATPADALRSEQLRQLGYTED